MGVLFVSRIFLLFVFLHMFYSAVLFSVFRPFLILFLFDCFIELYGSLVSWSFSVCSNRLDFIFGHLFCSVVFCFSNVSDFVSVHLFYSNSFTCFSDVICF